MTDVIWQGGAECRERGGPVRLGTLHLTEDELIFICGGTLPSNLIAAPLVAVGAILSFLGLVILAGPPAEASNYWAEGYRIPAILFAAMGPPMALLGLGLRASNGRDERRARAELADVDEAPGAMDLEDRYAVSPGSWRFQLAELVVRAGSSDEVRLDTEQGERVQVRTADARGLLEATQLRSRRPPRA